ncbi:hypothetical protein FA13DRAFT_1786039 [Coprinellus micaceus]|uniref:Uncharacterized protein n=1 Tax=Coprinellus micaceus TaxID=71717 RepID=A0A4Y7TVM1_COPMI|nr:hypothetical protein FA13DRAFT_1786039 [Coprinellus micaceus]
MSQVAAPSNMMAPGSVHPQYYQAPTTRVNQHNGGPPPQVQAAHVSPFQNGPYYPPAFFFHQQAPDGQNPPPQAYPYHPNWYPMQHHPMYQALAPPPSSQAPASASIIAPGIPAASEPATTRAAPSAPQPAFGIDPSMLADGELLPLPPSVPPHREPAQAPAITQVSAEGLGSAAPVENPGEASPEIPAQEGTVSRPNKRRHAEEDDGVEESLSDEEEDDGGKDGSASSPTESKKKRLVACKSNPIFKHVVGAGSGGELRGVEEQSDAEKIFCTRELPDPFALQAASTCHYRRNIPEIITRIENFASRCRCLAYFAIQHFESGENFYYYISDELRNWAPTDVREIHKKVASTFSSVMSAYQAAKVELQHEVETAKNRATEAERKATELTEQAVAMQKEHERLLLEHARDQAELQRLRGASAVPLA